MATATARRKTFGPLLYGTLILGALAVALVRIMTGTVWWVQQGRAAVEIDPDEAAAAYTATLTNPEPVSRAEAARRLGEILMQAVSGDDSTGIRGEAIAALRRALRDEEPLVRTAAADTLGWLQKPIEAAMADLTAALDDEDQGVQFAAARALLKMGAAAAPAERTLAGLLRDPTLAADRKTVVQTLVGAGATGEDAAVQTIQAMLADPNEDVRLDAADVLPALGQGMARISLEPLWSSPDPKVCFTTALAARLMAAPGSSPDPRVIAALEEAIADPARSYSIRERVLGILYETAPSSLRRCGRELARQLDLDNPNSRLDAANLLHMIDPETLAGKGGAASGR
jgi:HEAT repeat protein